MKKDIKKAVVLGAGTMGGGIAALLAGVGIKVSLLDIVLPELSEEDKKAGLTKDSKKFRNKVAAGGLDRALKSKPALFFSPEDANLITIGNIEDDVAQLKDADWIVEVVFERLDVKKKIFKLIDANRNPESIVSSNTSGISINAMTKDCSDALKQNTLVTHFFNPVRYMKLLEIVPTKNTKPEIVEFMCDFGERVLGKGIVIGKDTPNFIANRIGVFGMMYLMKLVEEKGYTVEEVDKVFGKAMGRPSSAVFRTADIVGLDVLSNVIDNIYANLPNDSMREIFKLTSFLKNMLEKKLFGSKTKQGFYKKVGKDILALDLKTLEYRPQEKVDFASLKKAKGIEDVGQRVKAVVNSDDKGGQMAWEALAQTLIYSAERIPEISDNVYAIDNALKWGFNWSLGPFENWDAIGVKESVARMEKENKKVPENVKKMLAKGDTSFYKKENGKKYYYDFASESYKELPTNKEAIFLSDIKDKQKPIKKLMGASLWDIGDGVALLEFHTKMNSIDNDIIEMINFSLDEVDKNFKGLVVANEGDTFSAGANVFLILMAINSGQWEQIEHMVSEFQKANMRMKYFHKPVVAAPFNMVLGGGAEVTMHANKVRAHSELYMGLVEFGMGLIPAGGGTKEVLVRNFENIPDDLAIDLFPFLGRAFQTIAMAKVSTSAKNAMEIGLLKKTDKITLSKDRLIADAKKQVLSMLQEGFTPNVPKKIKVLGRCGIAYLKAGIKNFLWAKQITEHESIMAEQLAKVLCGGDRQEGLATEQDILDLEREVFLYLCGTEKTKERISYFLQNNKPLRN